MFNTNIPVILYNDDDGYRNVYRKIFCLTNMDDEDDEDTYKKIDRDMAKLFSQVQHSKPFVALCSKLAGTFLTEEPTVGMIVLFTYTHLPYAYPLICDIIADPNYNVLLDVNYQILMHLDDK